MSYNTTDQIHRSRVGHMMRLCDCFIDNGVILMVQYLGRLNGRNNRMRFYILLRDELGETFGVTMYAESLNDCLDLLADEYPESSVVDVNAVNMGS